MLFCNALIPVCLRSNTSNSPDVTPTLNRDAICRPPTTILGLGEDADDTVSSQMSNVRKSGPAPTDMDLRHSELIQEVRAPLHSTLKHFPASLTAPPQAMPPEIVELNTNGAIDMIAQIRSGLMRPAGQRELPTMLLYNEHGLRLYDDITTQVPEYYLFGAEEEILKSKGDEIVRAMHRGEDIVSEEVVLELGAGALRKTSHILLSLARLVPDTVRHSPVTYFALDLEKGEIQRTLDEINADIGSSLHGKVEIKGMCATYEDGLEFVEAGGLNLGPSQFTPSAFLSSGVGNTSPMSDDSSPSRSESSESGTTPPSTPGEVSRPLHVMFLGSSLGNFGRESAAEFLRSLPLRRGSQDTLLLGLDHDNDKAIIEEAYNDSRRYTERFIMNGLSAAGTALGDEDLFHKDKWEYVNKYTVALRQHEAFYKAKETHTVCNSNLKQDITFEKGEEVKVEQSFKFSETDTFTLFANGNLRPIQRWTDSSQRYSVWLLERPAFVFPMLKAPTTNSTPFGVPTIQDWQLLWSAWDCVSKRMIPPSMLHQKPIDLRHICLFYLGHIPAFLDIQLSRVLNEPNTEPEEYKFIFERGIDPNVDDPTQCHAHSEVPENDEDWPSLIEILQYQARVRARLSKLYDDLKTQKMIMTRRIARALFMTLEHEAEHIETLLYMLVQRAGTGTLPPPGFAPPLWESLAANWDSTPPLKTETLTLGPAHVNLGHDDFEKDDTSTDVHGYEFGWDNESPMRTVFVEKFSISWRPVTNGQFYEFYIGEGNGKVELPKSWVEEDGEIKVRTLYGPVPMKIAQNWPVMTSYDDLSAYATVKGGRLPTEPELRLFQRKFDAGYKGGANVGFRNWHPIPATTGGEHNNGKGTNGGVWEWTSTALSGFDGFTPSVLYPGYSADFFDGIHYIVIGGSYATIPRISERKTFVNWYQTNYPYAWIGGRIVYDIAK